mmetsp:Transcript_15130/g.37078  ORF Transcript_15130/g.37078 Transcript_15130/m.37078 type:complete len:349 (+) Transcript_15130:29-1075(+)
MSYDSILNAKFLALSKTVSATATASRLGFIIANLLIVHTPLVQACAELIFCNLAIRFSFMTLAFASLIVVLACGNNTRFTGVEIAPARQIATLSARGANTRNSGSANGFVFIFGILIITVLFFITVHFFARGFITVLFFAASSFIRGFIAVLFFATSFFIRGFFVTILFLVTTGGVRILIALFGVSILFFVTTGGVRILIALFSVTNFFFVTTGGARTLIAIFNVTILFFVAIFSFAFFTILSSITVFVTFFTFFTPNGGSWRHGALNGAIGKLGPRLCNQVTFARTRWKSSSDINSLINDESTNLRVTNSTGHFRILCQVFFGAGALRIEVPSRMGSVWLASIDQLL